jgi:threonine synthase
MKARATLFTVDDSTIIVALKESAHQGIFIEPTSAAAIAALKQYAGKISPPSKVLVILTGSGLKTTATIEKLL